MLAARHVASRTGQVVAGLIAGALTVVTFAVVDNVWLGIVSQQQTKIDGFASSGAASMREYLNHSLIGPAVFFRRAGGLGSGARRVGRIHRACTPAAVVGAGRQTRVPLGVGC